MLDEFRLLAREFLGASSQSFSMHAFGHLPHQVKTFGSLWSVSASMFESSYSQLKRVVTGTRNEGQLIVKRFLLRKCVRTRSIRISQDIPVPTSASSFPADDLKPYNCPFEMRQYFFRFSFRGMFFHSDKYPRKQTSASFFVQLKNGRFCKIDHIVEVCNGSLMCLCTELRKCGSVTQLLLPYSNDLLNAYWKTYVVDFGSQFYCEARDVSSNIVLLHHHGKMIATPVLDKLEHD